LPLYSQLNILVAQQKTKCFQILGKNSNGIRTKLILVEYASKRWPSKAIKV